MAGLGKVRLVVSFEHAELTGTFDVLVTNRVEWNAQRIIALYLHRGPIEPCHHDCTPHLRGEPYRALVLIQEALALARELSEPHGLADAFFFAAILHQLRREERLAQECAEAGIAVSNEHGLTLYQAMATITRGWALIDRGLEE